MTSETPAPVGFSDAGAGESRTEPAALQRVCRNCSVQSDSLGDFCPHCGTPYVRPDGASSETRPRRRKGAKIAVAAVAVLVVAGGVTTSLVITKRNHDRAEAARSAAVARAQSQADAERVAANKAARAKEQADAEAEQVRYQRSVRAELIADLEKSIVKDAKKSVTAGLLDGPVLRAACTPIGGGSTDDLTAVTGAFTCIAVTKKDTDGTESGYRYTATVNWDEQSYSWHLG